MTALLDNEQRGEEQAPDLLATFARAKESTRTEVRDLMQAFDRASHSRGEGDGSDGERKASDEYRPPEPVAPQHGKDSDRNR